MKKKFYASAVFALTFQAVFSQVSFSEPELFLPGLVNSANPEFGGTLSHDGKSFWFNRMSSDRSKTALMEARQTDDGRWQQAQTARFADTTARDIDPFAALAGSGLIFSSNRALPDRSGRGYDLWFADFSKRELAPLPAEVNSGSDEIFASMSRDGALYFARFEGSKAKIYRSKLENERFGPAQRLALPGTDSASLSNPAISPDGRFLIFASKDLGGEGESDLFISENIGGLWSRPQNLGAPVNSAQNDFAPMFAPDGQSIFFTSERPGIVRQFVEGQRRPGDIYRTAVSMAKRPAAASVSELPTMAEQAVRAVQKRYVEYWLRGDRAGVLSLFEPGARIAPSGMSPIDSLEKMRAFWFPNDGSTTVIHHFENEILAIDVQGEIAASFQKTIMDWTYEKGDTRFSKMQHGYSNTILRRQMDGSWKIWRHSWTDVSSEEGP